MKSSIRVAIFIAGLLFATNARSQNAAAREPAVDKEKVWALQPKPTDKTGIPNSKPPSATPVKKDAETGQNNANGTAAEPLPVGRRAEKKELSSKPEKPKSSTLELPQPYKAIE